MIIGPAKLDLTLNGFIKEAGHVFAALSSEWLVLY